MLYVDESFDIQAPWADIEDEGICDEPSNGDPSETADVCTMMESGLAAW